MCFRFISGFAVIAALLVPIGNEAIAQSAENDPKHGSIVRIIVPASMGGSFGLYGQLVARHLGKHLPGPSVIAQVMPGAGGLTALSYVYNAAPKDGSVVIVPHISVVLATVLNPDASSKPIGSFMSGGWLAPPP